jgi:hypothetical protein
MNGGNMSNTKRRDFISMIGAGVQPQQACHGWRVLHRLRKTLLPL